MATYASRPAWEVRARALTSARLAAPAALAALVAASLLVRITHFDLGFWIDEGLSVGIADRPLTDIPGALRQDGSPPLYYMLLNVWMGVAGRSEVATHALSLLCALLAVPVAFWGARALFGTRAGWFGAALAAVNPFLTQYAQEARMYALLALLGLVATAAFVRALAYDLEPRIRLRWAAGYAVALAAMFYTHNWALFFAAGCGVAWLGLIAVAPRGSRGALLRTGLVAFGGALLLYLPWVPTLLYQAAHTGAPWAEAPTVAALLAVPGRLLGAAAQVALLLAAGAGIAALLSRPEGRLTERGRATAALIVIALVTIVLAWAASQVSPAWANRYLAVGLAPLVLLAAGGLAYAGRLGVVGLVLAAALSLGNTPPSEKSNVRDVAETIAPSLRPGDLVVSTWPEQIPVLSYYLPEGLRYAALTGPVSDVGLTDWRDGTERLRATSAERNLKPLLDSLPRGRRLVLVEPIVYDLRRWSAPWTELVRLRSQEWRQYLANDPRFRVSAIEPPSPFPQHPNPIRATVVVRN